MTNIVLPRKLRLITILGYAYIVLPRNVTALAIPELRVAKRDTNVTFLKTSVSNYRSTILRAKNLPKHGNRPTTAKEST